LSSFLGSTARSRRFGPIPTLTGRFAGNRRSPQDGLAKGVTRLFIAGEWRITLRSSAPRGFNDAF
jgi:hypothetical protein